MCSRRIVGIGPANLVLVHQAECNTAKKYTETAVGSMPISVPWTSTSPASSSVEADGTGEDCCYSVSSGRRASRMEWGSGFRCDWIERQQKVARLPAGRKGAAAAKTTRIPRHMNTRLPLRCRS